VMVEYHWLGGYDRLPSLVADLVPRPPEISASKCRRRCSRAPTR
jgi:hypothetical protein